MYGGAVPRGMWWQVDVLTFFRGRVFRDGKIMFELELRVVLWLKLNVYEFCI